MPRYVGKVYYNNGTTKTVVIDAKNYPQAIAELIEQCGTDGSNGIRIEDYQIEKTDVVI